MSKNLPHSCGNAAMGAIRGDKKQYLTETLRSIPSVVAFLIAVMPQTPMANELHVSVSKFVATLGQYHVREGEIAAAQYVLRRTPIAGDVARPEARRAQAEEIIAAKKLQSEKRIRNEDQAARAYVRHKAQASELSAWLDVQEMKALDRLNANPALIEQRARERYEQTRDKTENQYPRKANLTILFIDTTARGYDGAVARAAELRGRLARGESFDALAAAESDDPAVKSSPERHTFDIFKPQAERAVATHVFEKMRVGEIVGPLPVSSGWILVRLNALTAPQPVPFAEVRERLMNEVRQSVIKTARQEAYDKLMPVRVELLPDAKVVGTKSPPSAESTTSPDIESIRKRLLQDEAARAKASASAPSESR